MKKTALLIFAIFCVSISYAQNPFEKFGYTPKIGTLSKGKYIEHFDQDSIVQIGSVLLNPYTKAIVGFVKQEKLYSEATLKPEIVSRWMSPDPLADEFPDKSPYVFTNNNPIRFTDPLGLAPEDIIIKGDEEFRQAALADLQALTNDKLVIDDNGMVTISSSGSENCDCNLPEGTALVADLIGSDKTVEIVETSGRLKTQPADSNGNINDDGTAGKGTDSKVSFNTKLEESGVDVNGNTKRATSIGLGHELGHARDIANGTRDTSPSNPAVKDPDPRRGEPRSTLSKGEVNARRFENKLRGENNLPLRLLDYKKRQ